MEGLRSNDLWDREGDGGGWGAGEDNDSLGKHSEGK
jgi:hypothetical protein